MRSEINMQLIPNHKLSYVIAKACYRDIDVWEERHSASGNLDLELYNDMYGMISSKLREYIPCIKLLKLTKEEFDALEGTISTDDKYKLWAFILYSKESKIWDKPVLCEEPVSDDVVSYIMSGKLREACETELKLTDALMEEINIDVHNRVYTLIERGILI